MGDIYTLHSGEWSSSILGYYMLFVHRCSFDRILQIGIVLFRSLIAFKDMFLSCRWQLRAGCLHRYVHKVVSRKKLWHVLCVILNCLIWHYTLMFDVDIWSSEVWNCFQRHVFVAAAGYFIWYLAKQELEDFWECSKEWSDIVWCCIG